MASRASSRRRNMPSSPSVPTIRPCVTFCLWWNAAFWSATRKGDAARATHWPQIQDLAIDDKPPLTAHTDGLLPQVHFTAIVAPICGWIVPFPTIRGEKEYAPGATFTGT